MSGIVCERLQEEQLPAFREFCRKHWGADHPLIHNEEMFDYYFRKEDGLNFVVALEEKGREVFTRGELKTRPREIHGVCGFIPVSDLEQPDIFISYILTRRDAPFGLSFKMMEQIRLITGCRTVSCNNIRKKTGGLYEFLEYTVGDMRQWYRLNSARQEYTLCSIPDRKIPDVESDSVDAREITAAEVDRFDFHRAPEQAPQKSAAYVKKRYFEYPWNSYHVFLLSRGGREALLVIRQIEARDAAALRVVDFIGDRSLIRHTGRLIDRLLLEADADFCDWYEYGVPPEWLEYAGFIERRLSDENVIPLYLTPLLMENVDITVFMSDAKDYMMFRADGDQDRPNLG